MNNSRNKKYSTLSRRYPFINTLKIIGAIIIGLLHHYAGHFQSYTIGNYGFLENNLFLRFLCYRGYLLTEMFFMLSGMLFFHVYAKKIYENTLTLDDFLLNKIIRFGPIIIASSLFFYVFEQIVFILTGGYWSMVGTSDCLGLLYAIFFMGGTTYGVSEINGPLWYISVLMLCYLLYFLVVKIFQKVHSKFIFLAPLIVGASVFSSGIQLPFINLGCTRGLFAFSVGAILEYLLHNREEYESNQDAGITHNEMLLSRINTDFSVIGGDCPKTRNRNPSA